MGQGSMSKVYRARDGKIGRVVCLKVLDKEKTARFEARFPGLKRPSEGTILTALHHQNVVKTFDHGLTTQGEQFVVMELIEGMGLNFLVETRSPHMIGKRIDYLVQMADGIEYVHQQGYLHRDICPRNILVDQEGVVKIIDFGLTIPYRPEFCKPGNRTGTPNYLAPELIKRVATDHRVDLFALGVTAYEMFTYHLPWEKSQSVDTLVSHLNRPGTDPRDHCPQMDDKLAQLLIKSVERDLRERYQSAGEFREALKQLPKQDY
jgi:serine/threonine protein kinase